VARDTILSCRHRGWGLPRVRLAEFGGHVSLGPGVAAIGPGIENEMIGVGELEVSMTLSAQGARVCHWHILPHLRAEQRKFGHRVGMIARHIMAGPTLQVWPKRTVRRRGVSGEQAVAGAEKITQGLAFGHSPLREHRRRSVAGDAVLCSDHGSRGLARVGLAKFGRHVSLGIGMDASAPLSADIAMTIGALSGAVLGQRENQKADKEGALLESPF